MDTTMRLVYGLIADALTAHFDGDMVRYDKVIGQITGDSNLAVCTFATMVGMLRGSGMTAAAVRATAREFLGPEPAPHPPPPATGASATPSRKPAGGATRERT